MKHKTIFHRPDTYASFPLLRQKGDDIIIGFFVAPVPDHCGLYSWAEMISRDDGESWENYQDYDHSDWPCLSSREVSDRFTASINDVDLMTGSFGFMAAPHKSKKMKMRKSRSLFQRLSKNDWKSFYHRIYTLPDVDIIVTFPRIFQSGSLILIPAYAILKEYDFSRCFVWRSADGGDNFKLWNMFPDSIDGNEMAFARGHDDAILAHIRSDNHPALMESWSDDQGLTWSYPTEAQISYIDADIEKKNQVYINEIRNVIGGPSHLLELTDGRLLCSFGYRFKKMGIRAMTSKDGGRTWGIPRILRDDGGYLSSLHKKARPWHRKINICPGNDIGYPVSIQLKDDSILTAYYVTPKDRVTQIAITKWSA